MASRTFTTTLLAVLVLMVACNRMHGVRFVKRRSVEAETAQELADSGTNASEQSSQLRAPYLSHIYFSESGSGASEEDVRKGSGGAYIYPYYQYTSSAAHAIKSFTFVRGGSSGVGCPAGFHKTNKDLNKGAGGSYNYLCYTKKGGSPITAVTFLKFGGHYNGLHYGSWHVHPQDVLESGGGKYVYLAYQMPPTGATCLPAHHSQTAPQTAWDGAWTREAPRGMVITDISSHHDNNKEDRVWTFGYSTVTPLTYLDDSSHQWTGQTSWHASWSLTCPVGYVTSGFRSSHANNMEDRVWSMKCTKLWLDAWNGHGPVYTQQGAHNRTDLNAFDRPLNFKRGDAREMIIGLSSYYSGGARDRRFSIKTARHCLVNLPR